MNEIVAFAAAVSHTVNIAKAVFDTRDATKIGELQLEFTTALLDVAQKQLAVTESYQATLDANKKLKQQIEAYERWEQDSQRYQLHQLEPGILVYALKPEHTTTQPAHWLCAACYDDRKKSVLQRESKGSDVLICPRDPQHQLITEERGGGPYVV